jgi:predicted ester cyclase
MKVSATLGQEEREIEVKAGVALTRSPLASQDAEDRLLGISP